MIFVFGSNLAGFHGAGAAKYAKQYEGAEWGVGEGRTGNCYALPTKGMRIEFIPLWKVEQAVERFLYHAEFDAQSGEEFKVTQVGCGLGGFTKEQIAPLFTLAPPNCLFDKEWHPILGDTYRYWGTIPGVSIPATTPRTIRSI